MDSDDTGQLAPLSLDWIDRMFGGTDCVVLNPRHETIALSDMNKHEGELYLSALGYHRSPAGEWTCDRSTILWSKYSSWVDVKYACGLLITMAQGFSGQTP